ncbi:hypothetical protein [Actinomadura sp. 21ATH]|uniref:hypothetical protein n=1 Tax=Actinomadura sp. 21ATH TaxID=1735444 RepID=UPI0035C1EB75
MSGRLSGEELSPAEALARIGQTQQKAFERHRVPLWYIPGLVAVVTLFEIALDYDELWINLVGTVAGIAALAGLVVLVRTRNRITWHVSTWTPRTLAVYLVWAALMIGSAYGTHALADGIDQPWRKLLAGLAAVALVTATTRPLEALLVRLSRGRVAG